VFQRQSSENKDATMALYTIDNQDIYLEETGPENSAVCVSHPWMGEFVIHMEPILPALESPLSMHCD